MGKPWDPQWKAVRKAIISLKNYRDDTDVPFFPGNELTEFASAVEVIEAAEKVKRLEAIAAAKMVPLLIRSSEEEAQQVRDWAQALAAKDWAQARFDMLALLADLPSLDN